MLFGKTIDDPKVNIASMRTYLAHQLVRSWLRIVVAHMVHDQGRRAEFISDMQEHVMQLENDLADPVAFVANPHHLEKCVLVMENVLRLMPTGKWGRLERLMDRLDVVNRESSTMRAGIALIPKIDLKEDRYPPAWEELV